MVDTKIFRQRDFVFILTHKKIVVKTPHQAFYLTPREPYLSGQLRCIRRMIENDEIATLNDLALSCAGGIVWVNTYQEYELDKVGQLA